MKPEIIEELMKLDKNELITYIIQNRIREQEVSKSHQQLVGNLLMEIRRLNEELVLVNEELDLVRCKGRVKK